MGHDNCRLELFEGRKARISGTIACHDSNAILCAVSLRAV